MEITSDYSTQELLVTLEDTNLNDILAKNNLLDSIEKIELVSKEDKEAIQPWQPLVNVFVKVILSKELPISKRNYLYVGFKKEHKGDEFYNKVVLIAEFSNLGPLQVINYQILNSFDLSVEIPANPEIGIYLPNQELKDKFNKLYPNHIGSLSKLICMVKISKEEFFFGYQLRTYIGAQLTIIFSPVNELITLESEYGQWSHWKAMNDEVKELTMKVANPVGGMTVEPLMFRSQVVHGINYDVIALVTFAGVGYTVSFVNYKFNVSEEGIKLQEETVIKSLPN